MRLVQNLNHSQKSNVAPAEAGAYLVCRFKRRGLMGRSLRWGDGLVSGEVQCPEDGYTNDFNPDRSNGFH